MYDINVQIKHKNGNVEMSNKNQSKDQINEGFC